MRFLRSLKCQPKAGGGGHYTLIEVETEARESGKREGNGRGINEERTEGGGFFLISGSLRGIRVYRRTTDLSGSETPSNR